MQTRLLFLIPLTFTLLISCSKDDQSEITAQPTKSPPVKDTTHVDKPVYIIYSGQDVIDNVGLNDAEISDEGGIAVKGSELQNSQQKGYVFAISASNKLQCVYDAETQGLGRPAFSREEDWIYYVSDDRELVFRASRQFDCASQANLPLKSVVKLPSNASWGGIRGIIPYDKGVYMLFTYRLFSGHFTTQIWKLPTYGVVEFKDTLDDRDVTKTWPLTKNRYLMYDGTANNGTMYIMKGFKQMAQKTTTTIDPDAVFPAQNEDGSVNGFYTYKYNRDLSQLNITKLDSNGSSLWSNVISVSENSFVGLGPDLKGGFFVAMEGSPQTGQASDQLFNCQLKQFSSLGQQTGSKGFSVDGDLLNFEMLKLRQIPDANQSIVAVGRHETVITIEGKTLQSSYYLYTLRLKGAGFM